jgi:uncharacterized membrane protein YfcA
MTNLPKEDRIAMSIFSVLFLGGGAVLRFMGMHFYWMSIVIGVILGAVVLGSKVLKKRSRKRHRYRESTS